MLRAGDDEAVKVIVLRGAGRAFCAGFDFAGGFHHWDERITTDGRVGSGQGLRRHDVAGAGGAEVHVSIWRMPKPVIAQVHGWCVGGGSDMALCADLVDRDARTRASARRTRACGAPT